METFTLFQNIIESATDILQAFGLGSSHCSNATQEQTRVSRASAPVSGKELHKSFFKSQLPHNSVNLHQSSECKEENHEFAGELSFWQNDVQSTFFEIVM